jgi:cbb3-type cytochrome oxidase subunit 3
MTLVLITALIGVISITFCFISVRILYRYINRYRFDESKYTLLFGFLHLRYIQISYITLTVVLAILSTIFMFYITL